MSKVSQRILLTLALLVGLLSGTASVRADVKGWLEWRGPHQTGVSTETDLPETWKLHGENDLWSADIQGGGTPVIANGHVYIFGYGGEGADLQEIVACFDAKNGKKLWEHRYSDFISDIVYDRYAIGSPCIDPKTGNVSVITSAGLFLSFTPSGKVLWQNSLMETLGRLTFTNGRTGSPFIDGDFIYFRFLTGNWGGDSPGRDRFYAFDKKSGKLVWASAPGDTPKDPSFSRPWFDWYNGLRVMYTGTGCGNIVALNARTGQPLWRYPVSAGGFSSSIILYKGMLIGIHDDENLNSPEIGGMVAIRIDGKGTPAEAGAPIVPSSVEVWRNRERTVSSSPVLIGERLYVTNRTGELACVDANNGKVIWRKKLAPDQLHASPLYADGKLYVPFQNGLFYILRPGESDCQELEKVQLEGRCIGAPSVYDGRVYVLTTKRLYCLGKKSHRGKAPAWASEWKVTPGATVALQIIPQEVLLRPGEKVDFTIRGIDANGFVTQVFDSKLAKWEKYIPPTARVRSNMSASVNENGELVADSAALPSAGAFMATIDGFKGVIRGRVLPAPPQKEDFEGFQTTETSPFDGGKFAYPPLGWIGARLKWDVREVDGNKVLAKTLDNVFFQRSTVFFGQPSLSNYTLEADVRMDGNRRTKSTVGLINQHYLIALQGNAQELEITSTPERVKTTVPFKITAGTWYHLKTRVDIAADGSGIVRAKAWARGEAEPSTWTVEFKHKDAHKVGAPGLFGFAPQSLFKCYLDNIAVTPN
ncbi:serine/threonine protein kinase [Armatimonadota bacterium]|nr:serine/threonine protein kinase [Armatimonadota bacterium]